MKRLFNRATGIRAIFSQHAMERWNERFFHKNVDESFRIAIPYGMIYGTGSILQDADTIFVCKPAGKNWVIVTVLTVDQYHANFDLSVGRLAGKINQNRVEQEKRVTKKDMYENREKAHRQYLNIMSTPMDSMLGKTIGELGLVQQNIIETINLHREAGLPKQYRRSLAKRMESVVALIKRKKDEDALANNN